MSDKPKCKGPECDREFVARELCGTHLQQLYAGKELTPIRKPKTLEQSKKEFTATTSQKVNTECVRSSATEYDAKVTEEAFDKWLFEHDAEVLQKGYAFGRDYWDRRGCQ